MVSNLLWIVWPAAWTDKDVRHTYSESEDNNQQSAPKKKSAHYLNKFKKIESLLGSSAWCVQKLWETAVIRAKLLNPAVVQPSSITKALTEKLLSSAINYATIWWRLKGND